MSMLNGPPPPPLSSSGASPAPPLRPSPSSPSGPPPVRLSNHYTRRLTSSPKACFVCSRPSPIVLVSNTAGAEDFFYVCASHLTDRHFATLINKSGVLGTPTDHEGRRLPDRVAQEEIDKVKNEWEDRQKARKERREDKDKKDSKDDPDGKDKKDETQGWLSYLTSSLNAATSASSDKAPSQTRSESLSTTTSMTASKGHEEYCLHRSFYSMRVDAHNKKVALKRAKELNFPSVPRQ